MNTGGRHTDFDAGDTTDLYPATTQTYIPGHLGGDYPVAGRSEIELAEADRAGLELADDPFDDDLAEQLAARAPRRVVTRSTLVFAAVLLAVGGFAAGAPRNTAARGAVSRAAARRPAPGSSPPRRAGP